MAASYLKLHESGELAHRVETALSMLKQCRVCPRECGVDRLNDERGFCGVGRRSVVASYNAHFGEEAPLVGERGSGTVFFAGCNLGCLFCQNHDISHDAEAGIKAEPDELAGVMLSLQNQGCHNINFVTPSHVIPQILEALPIAIGYGLTVPLVYNTSSYDSPETLWLLDGVMDIYMPDVKIWEPEPARKYLRAQDYPEHARNAVREMHRQVGDLQMDANGIAEHGMLVRHLIMPDDIAGTEQWMAFLAELSTNTYVNIMDQYRPCGNIDDLPEIKRMITSAELRTARSLAEQHGLHRLDERKKRFFRMLFRKKH